MSNTVRTLSLTGITIDNQMLRSIDVNLTLDAFKILYIDICGLKENTFNEVRYNDQGYIMNHKEQLEFELLSEKHKLNVNEDIDFGIIPHSNTLGYQMAEKYSDLEKSIRNNKKSVYKLNKSKLDLIIDKPLLEYSVFPEIHKQICDTLNESDRHLPYACNSKYICETSPIKILMKNTLYNPSMSKRSVISQIGLFYPIGSWQMDLFFRWATSEMKYRSGSDKFKYLITLIIEKYTKSLLTNFAFSALNKHNVSQNITLLRMLIAISIMKTKTPFGDETPYDSKYRCKIIYTKLGYEFGNLSPADEIMLSISKNGNLEGDNTIGNLLSQSMHKENVKHDDSIKAMDLFNVICDKLGTVTDLEL